MPPRFSVRVGDPAEHEIVDATVPVGGDGNDIDLLADGKARQVERRLHHDRSQVHRAPCA